MNALCYNVGDKVRVRTTAIRHAGRIGYIDSIGEDYALGTVILCTENRTFKGHNRSTAILFAVFVKDIELISTIVVKAKSK